MTNEQKSRQRHERFRLRIGNRILIAVIALIFVLTGGLLSYFIFSINDILDDEQEYQGHALAESIAQSSELGILSGEAVFLEAPFTVAMENPTTVFVTAYDAQGRLVAERSRGAVEPRILSDEAHRVLMGGGTTTERVELPRDGEEIDIFSTPVRVGTTDDALTVEMLESPGTPTHAEETIGLVQVGLSRERIAAVQLRSISVTIATSAIVMAIGIIIAILLSRRITRPIQHLERGTRRIADGTLDVTLPVESDDEVGALARSFNVMVEALQETTVSRDYVDGIIRSIVDILLVTDAEGTIQFVNEAAVSTFCYSEEKILGSPITRCFPIDEERFRSEIWTPLLEEGALVQYETEAQRCDGTRFDVAISGARLKQTVEGKTNIVLIARDITEKKQAAEAMAEKLRYIQKINDLMVGREMRIVQIKEEVNTLLEELGRPRKYLS